MQRQAPLYHLLGGHEVVFCHSPAATYVAYQSGEVREAAALINGCPYIVRTSLSPSCPCSSISQAVADALGLARQRLHGGGARGMHGRLYQPLACSQHSVCAIRELPAYPPVTTLTPTLN